MPTYKFTIHSYPPKLSPKVKTLAGQVFDRLLVIGFAGVGKFGHSMWHVICECGNGTTVSGNDLLREHHRSCGCWQIEQTQKSNTKHGEAVNGVLSPEYRTYMSAKTRCQGQTTRDYQKYGARGIEFRFESFDEFLTEMGRRPSDGHSIDRIDTNGHYERGNVRWATVDIQAVNRRTTHWIDAFGKRQCLSGWAREYNCHPSRIATRLKRGWCNECSIALHADQGGKITCLHKHLIVPTGNISHPADIESSDIVGK